MPSSFAMVPIVPIMPRYFSVSPGFGADCNCRRTLAVSMGKVHASAQHVATAEQPNVFHIGMLVLLPPPVMMRCWTKLKVENCASAGI